MTPVRKLHSRHGATLFLLLLCGGAVGLGAEQAGLGSFKEMSVADKVIALRQLSPAGLENRSDTPASIIHTLDQALRDGDPEVRDVAARVVSAHALRARFDDTFDTRLWTGAVEPADLRLLTEQLYHAFREDQDMDVRLDSLIALGCLEYRRGESTSRYRLSNRLVGNMLAAYEVEPKGRVRAEIIKALALTETRSKEIEEVLVEALDDPASEVVQPAVYGVALSKLIAAFPRLVPLLKHQERGVRVEVAQAFASLGAAASSYLPWLRAALETESDPTVRSSLAGAIATIERAKAERSQ